jgi:hypothetical protein
VVLGLAAAAAVVYCALPALLAVAAEATFAGLGRGSWLVVVAGIVLAAASLWSVRRRALQGRRR